jgi:arginine utilization regulatory protein
MKKWQRPPIFQQTDLINIDFLAVLDNFDDGVIIADQQGKILYFNQSQEDIDGIEAEEAVGKHVTEVYQLSGETSLIMQCIRNRSRIRHKSFFYKTANGKIAHTICSVYPLIEHQKVIGAICFVRDYKILKNYNPVTPTSCPEPQKGNGTRYTFTNIIGNNRELVRSINTAKEAANSKSPILIIGETGTGKELFAQAIHNHSARREKDYLAINCAAIPENLLEGLLFGTVKGAFTGAVDRAGLFEKANGSTLFLDELLTMPLPLQAKLLRVLQEKRVCRLGSTKEIPLDIKVISSVAKPPRDAIKDEELRVDLFYRLGVVVIKIPPLRSRVDDIEELVQHFLVRLNSSFGTYVKGVSSEVKELFHHYSWPGNVREMEHLLEGAMNIVGLGEQLELKHFSSALETLNVMNDNGIDPVDSPVPNMTPEPDAESLPVDISEPLTGSYNSLPVKQNEQERLALQQALTATSGNISKSAEILGISRQLLNYKMKKHGLHRKSFA